MIVLLKRLTEADSGIHDNLLPTHTDTERSRNRFMQEGVNFAEQAEMMGKATSVVLAMVRQLRQMEDLEKIKEFNDKLQYVEAEADRLMMELLKELYSGKYDALRAIVIRDLYELIEKVVDRCRDVGNTVTHIVLKNS